MGALKSVAAIYKHGKREDLLKYAPTVLKIVQDSKLDKHENVVIQKLGVKLMQRLGLTFLKVNKKFLSTYRKVGSSSTPWLVVPPKRSKVEIVARPYKHGKRKDLLKYAPTVLKIVQDFVLLS